ncbi:MAG: ABC transporter substrate-binding protein [Nitrospinae bacterium RIFCSPLOWO2_12_FULL_47_7]|nr:MAG: ABC transporter substrate-binding protein [Nitrospinae bacterium RIFCSPLOWO2_12_FULL_47_7]
MSLSLFLMLNVTVAQAADKKIHIKFATLAPEGSTWMKEMHRLDKEVQEATGGSVALKFYAGGVSGDEMDVIRKMRIGQIHAAGFTGVGLGEILPEVRVLDLPFLFENDRQVEHIYEAMDDYFSKKFAEKGYVLLGWVPVGWVHFFSKYEIRTIDDLKKTKSWMWEGDPLAQEAYSVLNVKPFPLSVTDVLMSLQTGMIDTVYTSPVGALALQWFSKVNYMSGIRMGNSTGAVLMTKEQYERVPPENRKQVLDISRRILKDLIRKTQDENAKSIDAMMKSGLRPAALPVVSEVEKFHQAGASIRQNLTGKLFSKELLDKVLSHLKEVR